MKVEVIKRYFDNAEGRKVNLGEILTVDSDRAAMLEGKKLVKRVAKEVKPKKDTTPALPKTESKNGKKAGPKESPKTGKKGK